jgi:CBS domain-containing protein
MEVKHLMTKTVKSCCPADNLGTAAGLMWDGDCGVLPVVSADSRVVGMITDRDICMAAYTQGRQISEITVEPIMSKQVISLSPDDLISTAEKLMQSAQVRRLPVLDADQKLVGIISINDLAREAARERPAKTKQIEPDDIAVTLAAVCRPRNGHVAVTSAA